jgi:Zn-dependent protease
MIFFRNPITVDYWIILLLFLLVIYLSYVIHEWGHRLFARMFGDTQFDHLGSIWKPSVVLAPGGVFFFLLLGIGWGKQARINPFMFQHPNRYVAITSLQGPLLNIALAVLAYGVAQFILPLIPYEVNWLTLILIYFFGFMIYVNGIMGIVNLIPFPGFDGEKVVRGIFFPFLSYRSRMNFPTFANYLSIALMLVLLVIWLVGILPSLYPLTLFDEWIIPQLHSLMGA